MGGGAQRKVARMQNADKGDGINNTKFYVESNCGFSPTVVGGKMEGEQYIMAN